ncbi:MAG TPA: DUF58 domain-containing protein [Anaeromyxobacteraceae bacterium]|nr:DUF58 domain-containing protein [Anaeromyxobacteraceae bacterium]
MRSRLPVPTPRAALLLAAGALLALAGMGGPALGWTVLALDAAVLGLVLADAALAPAPGSLRASRRVREPLSAFAPNRVDLAVESASPRRLRLDWADAPPASFDSAAHRGRIDLPPGGVARLSYEAVPRARGAAEFGDLHLRARGPLGLAARQWTVPLAATVKVYPDLRGLARLAGAAALEAGRPSLRGLREGREFASLRPYQPGDDFRSIDWKATARRGAPVVREWQPERNQTLWLLLDCGRHLSARLADGRTKLDHAVDAALSLARAAVSRGDRPGAVLFAAGIDRVVPPGAGRTRLGPLAEALHAAQARVEEADYGAAFDALDARQRRRALVVVFTDLADPETSALLLARAAQLRLRHLVLVAAVADSEIADAARAEPRDQDGAYQRVAAERILDERDAAARRLTAAGVRVESVPARDLAAAVLGRYREVKDRGEL